MKKYSAGYYQVESNDPDYNDLLTMTADGDAALEGKRFLEGGVIQAFFRVGKKRNPAIKVGAGFFANALRDYENWKIKWWRECVQNAVDAGARDVYLDSVENDDGTWAVICEDNGRGMTEEVLLNKFLVLGETGKSAREGQIGGFGKAKELLILPWLEWRIESRDLVAEGSGIEYNVKRGNYLDGTRLTVVMPADERTNTIAATEFLQRCSIKGVRFYIHGERFNERLLPGKFVSNLSFGDIYHNKSKKFGRVFVRANGMYMFDSGYLDYEIGTLVVELSGDTTKILTANRDGFRSWKLRGEIDAIMREIQIEGERALKAKSKTFTKVWKGESKITTEQGMTDVLDVIGTTPEVKPGKSIQLTKSSVAEVVNQVEELQRYYKGVGQFSGVPEKGVVEHVAMEPLKGQANVEALAQQLVWTPPFILHNELENYTVPKKFYPERMAPKALALLKVWTEACRWVFIQLGSQAEYGVGFVFSEDTVAQYQRLEDGTQWLLINPYRDIRERGELLAKGVRDDLKNIYASAIHEVTHMADGYDAHDAAFAAALTENFAKCSDGFKTLVKVSKAIKIEKTPTVPLKDIKKKAAGTVPIEITREGGVIYYEPTSEGYQKVQDYFKKQGWIPDYNRYVKYSETVGRNVINRWLFGKNDVACGYGTIHRPSIKKVALLLAAYRGYFPGQIKVDTVEEGEFVTVYLDLDDMYQQLIAAELMKRYPDAGDVASFGVVDTDPAWQATWEKGKTTAKMSGDEYVYMFREAKIA